MTRPLTNARSPIDTSLRKCYCVAHTLLIQFHTGPKAIDSPALNMESSSLSFKAVSKLVTPSLPLLFSAARSTGTRCLSLKSSLNLENTTIIDVSYVLAGSQVATLGTCDTTANVSVPLCRVQFFTNTTDTSVVHAEAWIPDEYYGRFLGLGNPGLDGCIDYGGLDYGSFLHFDTVGSDNRHDTLSGAAFLGHSEIINEFAFRAVHVEAVIGEQIADAYYGRPHRKSYYMGCSTGGRQGTQAALKFPADFDGVLARATDFNHLVDWTNMLAQDIGAPDPGSSPTFIPQTLWDAIAAEIMNQCDDIDGVVDGIIAEPDACEFRPEVLLCGSGAPVKTLRKIYSPLYGRANKLLYRCCTPVTTLPQYLCRATSSVGCSPSVPKYTAVKLRDRVSTDAPQFQRASNAVNTSSHNILLALVDWVEGGVALDTIIGTADNEATRAHCRYPERSVWNVGKMKFKCEV
ncbi:tannase and feruloyl esterase-domain-containing protein [Mycena olivaceomarginata]|nr:tannase and feruloyl esterase-domain-containing protein [Mycena olivaceomarginata]